LLAAIRLTAGITDWVKNILKGDIPEPILFLGTMLCIKLLSAMRPLLNPFLLGLVMTLALGHADGALAARSGVESVVVPLEHPAVPTRLLVAPTPPGGGYYPYPGGFGFLS